MTSKTDGKRMTCVFCREEVSEDAASCPRCGQSFPWVKQFDQMRDLMKEREPNRVRATWVVVEEVFGYLNTGKPLSQSAIKGLIGAWLFPRTLIVIGSVVTGLVLIGQTYILKRQTELLDVQTKAAQIEQESKLRERLAAVTPYLDAWAQIARGIEKPLELGQCRKCSPELAFTKDLAWTVRSHAGILQNEMMAAIHTLRRLTEKEREERPWAEAADAFAIASAKVCLMAPADATSLRKHLALYVGSLDWLANALESKLVSREAAAAYSVGIPQQVSTGRDALTNGAFLEALEKRRRNAEAVASNAMKDCRDLRGADQERLKMMLPAAPVASLRDVVEDVALAPEGSASWPRRGASR